MRYLPHTDSEIKEMLAAIGVGSIEELFSVIPEPNRLKRELDLPPALDEAALMRHLTELSAKNEMPRMVSFLGGGIYDHHIPPTVDQLLLRSEFYTAYTPYQAEASQGTLQAMFEFQTIVSELFGLEVANASMYDAASGTAEAVLMARRITKRAKAVISQGVHPEYVQTTRTYLHGVDAGEPAIAMAPSDADGRTDLAALESLVDDDTAAIVVGYPNFFGIVEDLPKIRAIAAGRGALLVTTTAEPYALSLIAPPGACGADIAVGEGQALATAPSLGGPGVGLFACRQSHVRQMPGRVVGETVDERGDRGFVLTLNTREQHIRRERATSNICTNHGLIALALTIRTALLGKRGFVEVGKTCLARAEYLKAKIRELDGFELPYAAPTFNEFVVRRTDGKAAPLLAALAAKNILGGIDLGRFDPALEHDFLVAVTERHGREDLDAFVNALASV